MLTIRACSSAPNEKTISIRLPRRLTRIRRNVETKRMESLKTFHESLKKIAREEHDLLKSLVESKNDNEDEDEDKKFEVDEE